MESRQAHWFLDNGFSIWIPDSIDPGHPPVFSIILSGLWKLVGRSLWIGHLFVIVLAGFLIPVLYKFLSFYIKKKLHIHLALILLLANTILLNQFVLISTDIILILFFFACLNAIHNKMNMALVFLLIGLGFSNMRGMMSCAIIGLYHIGFIYLNEKKSILFSIQKIFLYYLPVFVLATGFLYMHHIQKGWTITHPESPWAGCYVFAGLRGMIRNAIIIVWRLVDFGNLFVWLSIIFLAFLLKYKKLWEDNKIKSLVGLLLLSMLVYFPTMLIYRNLAGHRYIIPVHILLGTLLGYILFEKLENIKLRRTIYVLSLLGLLSGNFWIYPAHIAKGWDSNLAHLPYDQLRKKMIKYLDAHNIPFEQVGTDTPNRTKLKYVDLSNDERCFPTKNLDTQPYIFYSNIFNNFTNEELETLKSKWEIVKAYKKMQVKVILYRNPAFKNSTLNVEMPG